MKQYADDTFEQVLKGNYTDKATALGIALQMLAGIPNLDVAMDARDLLYDLTHLKTTPPGQVGLDAMAFAPVFGSLKYVGDIAKVAKAGDGVVDAITEIGKHADDLADVGKHADDTLALTKYLDDAAAAAKQSEGVLDTAGKLDYNKIGQYSSEEVRHWYVQQVSNIHSNIDSSLPMAEQAYQAFKERNRLRTTARNLMSDQECRRVLDVKKANASFDDLLNGKMNRKGLTYEEALEDIYNTAITTNETVNKTFHIGG